MAYAYETVNVSDHNLFNEVRTLSESLAFQCFSLNREKTMTHEGIHQLFIASLCAIIVNENVESIVHMYPLFAYFDEYTYATRLQAVVQSQTSEEGKKNKDLKAILDDIGKAGCQVLDHPTGKLIELIRHIVNPR